MSHYDEQRERLATKETVNLYSGRITPEQEDSKREDELQDTRQNVQEINERLNKGEDNE